MKKDVAKALLAAYEAARSLIEPQLELKKKLDLKAIENKKMPKTKQELARTCRRKMSRATKKCFDAM